MSEQQCLHCGIVRERIEATISNSEVNGRLCHPPYNDAPDCYRLVTIYGHKMPCIQCQKEM